MKKGQRGCKNIAKSGEKRRENRTKTTLNHTQSRAEHRAIKGCKIKTINNRKSAKIAANYIENGR